MKKPEMIFIQACNDCPFHKETPAQGANDHTCELKQTYLNVNLQKKEIDADCPLKEQDFTFRYYLNLLNF